MEFRKTGYRYLKQLHSEDTKQTKEDKEFIRVRAVEVSGWLNSLTTLHLKEALYKDIERLTEKVLVCDNVDELKFLQGQIIGVKTILNRLNSLRDSVKKHLQEE